MNRTSVKSSQIAQIGYDAEKQVLEIEFKGKGAVYQYSDVPKEVHTGLLAADSVGKYFNENIKGAYKFTKL